MRTRTKYRLAIALIDTALITYVASDLIPMRWIERVASKLGTWVGRKLKAVGV